MSRFVAYSTRTTYPFCIYSNFTFFCSPVPPPTPTPRYDQLISDNEDPSELAAFFEAFNDQPENDEHLNFPVATPMPRRQDD